MKILKFFGDLFAGAGLVSAVLLPILLLIILVKWIFALEFISHDFIKIFAVVVLVGTFGGIIIGGNLLGLYDTYAPERIAERAAEANKWMYLKRILKEQMAKEFKFVEVKHSGKLSIADNEIPIDRMPQNSKAHAIAKSIRSIMEKAEETDKYYKIYVADIPNYPKTDIGIWWKGHHIAFGPSFKKYDL